MWCVSWNGASFLHITKGAWRRQSVGPSGFTHLSMANQCTIQDQLLHSSTLAHAPQHSMQQYTLLHAQAASQHGTSAHSTGTAKTASYKPRLPPTHVRSHNACTCCMVASVMSLSPSLVMTAALPPLSGARQVFLGSCLVHQDLAAPWAVHHSVSQLKFVLFQMDRTEHLVSEEHLSSLHNMDMLSRLSTT